MLELLGQTRWRLFAPLLLTGLTVTGIFAVGIAHGVLAASFLVSNRPYKSSARLSISHGVAQYAMVDVTWSGKRVPVIVGSARNVESYGVCQSWVFSLGPFGKFTLKLTAGQGSSPVRSSNAVTDAAFITVGKSIQYDVDSNIAAGAVTKGKIDPGDSNSPYFDPGSSAHQVATLVQRDIRTIVVASSADYSELPDAKYTVTRNGSECF
ncbi:DUF6230 family protein [Streptomyces chiangmaiensis]|uniref:DUF6230 family protein n=1 Tax=Streptomyces chiangmaiensis TaxID=766497 RepID=A0ABU7FVW4_9ACTN|nr:DUF6230 family protein [Streptomyces chiangmaiensis]MED7828260.1 DUF6230 family protein [Streptomyces chiangmaiensis]